MEYATLEDGHLAVMYVAEDEITRRGFCPMPRTWIEEAYYVQMPSGPISQGDVWTGIPSSHDNRNQSAGIVITPRCDLAHDKAPVVNFLPLLSFHEFMVQNGGFSLLARALKRADESIKAIAERLGILELLAVGISGSEALQLIESGKIALPEKIAGKRDLRDQLLKELKSALSVSADLKDILARRQLTSQTINKFTTSKRIEEYKHEVIRNTVSDLHFLPPCEPLLPYPAIVQLRNIGTLRIAFLNIALSCPSSSAWEALRLNNDEPNVADSVIKPDRILRLRSPYIECLMSRLGSLLSRVGVRDFHPDEIASFAAL